jgi:hypothetical protein
VYVQAIISDSRLVRICMLAQGVASAMFATVGARIHWKTGQPTAKAPDQPVLIDITSNTPETFHPGAFAYAYVFEGVHIRVFYDRMRNAYRPRATTMLLAHVLVHEITHILEGVDHHSDQGIMKAYWTADDLQQMAYKPRPFDPEDIQLIRHAPPIEAVPREIPHGLISEMVFELSTAANCSDAFSGRQGKQVPMAGEV